MDNKLFYIGKFGETVQHSEEDKDMVKEAELFSTGVHRGQEYTVDDLKTLADNFNAEESVPLQIDHSESAKDTVGFLEAVKVKGEKLMGQVRVIDEHAQSRITKKLMSKLSVSFYLQHTEEGFKPYKLREVSLVAFPQVKSARLFSENGYISDYEEQGGNSMDKVDLTELKAQLRTEVETEVHKEFSQLQARLEKLENIEEQFTETQITSKIEKFQADSKIVPAQGEALSRLLASFNEDQMKDFDEFMKNSQAVADFQEQGEVEQEDGEQEEKDERTQEEKDFDKFYEEHAKKYGHSL
ncbi:putative scaffold protein [Bacillus phage vB_BpsS-36]|uniref:Putative scaffold protein n=1 Tax=Bacillus phage vB_BpsS-36 TaxID=2419622 RepID=A0A3G3BWR0_9CAUD|nr:putative scaffold protein [Bacillus phage vB_BpsS-36]